MSRKRHISLLLTLIAILALGHLSSSASAQARRDSVNYRATEERTVYDTIDDSSRQETDIQYYRIEDAPTRQGNVIIADSSKIFRPDPTKAVWYSALCPGVGQIYNRSYWKIPIIVGGYLGLIYATNWNARYYNDYSTAYRDAMDNDPNTESYINFLAYNRRNDPDWIKANMAWLQGAMKRKKDYYRKYRDLCVISMIGVYFVAMLEAYVDAHLYNFDISDDLSMKFTPTVIEPGRQTTASFGVQCAITF